MSRRTPLGILRVAAAYLFVAFLIAISLPTPGTLAVGALLVTAGETIRIWAAGHLLKSKELAVSGPYRYTQNPLYLGRFLILTGFCIMAYLPLTIAGLTVAANLLVLAAGYAVFLFYYIPRKVRVEGTRLREIHGEAWEEYSRNVPILFPRTTPHGENRRRWDAGRMLRNREHWMAGFVALVSLIFLVKTLRGMG